MFCQRVESIHNVVKGVVRRHILVQAAVQYLTPLELQEAAEVAGAERRAQVLATLAAAVAAQLLVLGGARGWPEGVEGASLLLLLLVLLLVGVLQGQVDPVQELGRLVHGGAAVYG